MNLQRQLEPEAMDSQKEASEYDAMDHGEVNRLFVDDLLAAEADPGDVLDIGAGTALVPIELCQRCSACRVMASDLSVSMLELARYNIEIASLIDRIQLEQLDAKQLPQEDGYFATVMSNTVLHHIPEPLPALRQATRVLAPGGLIFIRDLFRPKSEHELQDLVEKHAGESNEFQRKLFADSLRAAFTLDEVRSFVELLGWDGDGVQATSDRHWTWCDRKPS